MNSYKNYFLGSVSQVSKCIEIVLFNKSFIKERISLTNLELFYNKYLTGLEAIECVRLTRDSWSVPFEYKKELSKGFDIIVYISSSSNSPIGFTEFLNIQGLGLTMGIILDIKRGLAGEVELEIKSQISKSISRDWQGDQLYQYSRRSDIIDRKFNNIYTSDLGRIMNDRFGMILGYSGIATKNVSYRLRVRRNIEINLLGNYDIFYYNGELVLAEWNLNSYRFYSLTTNNLYSGNTGNNIRRIVGRYYIDSNMTLRDLSSNNEIIKTKKTIFCDSRVPECSVYDLPVFYTKSNIFRYIPEINNIYLDLDNYLKSNRLLVVDKKDSWFILKREYGGSSVYIAVSPTSVLTMTEEDIEKAIFVNDQTIILKESDYYLVYHTKEKELFTERSRTLLLGGRLSDYIISEGVCKIQMCFLDTEEDQIHFEEYYGNDGLVDVIFNYEELSQTILNNYRKSVYPKSSSIPDLIGSYGGLIFYRINNVVNYL